MQCKKCKLLYKIQPESIKYSQMSMSQEGHFMSGYYWVENYLMAVSIPDDQMKLSHLHSLMGKSVYEFWVSF